MLTAEDGPFNAFIRLRESRTAKKFPLLDCLYCTSVWVAFPLAFLTDSPLLYWLPISVITIFIDLIHGRLES